MLIAFQLKAPCSINIASIINCIFNCSQAVVNCIFNLSNCMLVGAFYEESATEWISATFHESEFVIAENVFIHLLSVA